MELRLELFKTPLKEDQALLKINEDVVKLTYTRANKAKDY